MALSDPGPTQHSNAPEPAAPAGEVSPTASRSPRAAAKERTRAKVLFTSVLAGLIVLILLLVFILENTQTVKVSYFGAGGRIVLGLALLLAAVAGGVLVAIAGSARVLQLRRRIRRHAE